MENKQHHDHGSGFFNGFLLGAIIGAAVVFFLFTDKGKKLLKTITEEGMEGFSDLKDLVQDEMDDEEEQYDMAGDEHPYEEAHTLPRIVHHADHTHVEPIHGHSDEAYHSHEEPMQSSKVKRFFKRPKR